MARNCCGGGLGCGCKVSAGDGIIISGSGTASDPFVITSEVTSFAASFVAQDTTTVNMNLVGSGTNADPFILSADTSIAMTQLSDWDDPAGPSVGDVPVWNGLAWEAAVPPTVPPGAVTANTGITGDGTVVTPLKIAVSDTTTTSLTGSATYIDSAGKLRAVPGASDWASITGKPASFPTTWSDVAGKPTTFAPVIGTSATTAKAGNWFPTWSEVTGKPAIPVADFVTGSSGYAVMRIGTVANNAVGLYWDGGQPVMRVDATDFPLSTVALLSAVQTSLTSAINGKANQFGGVDAVRFAEGPTSNAYSRTVSGSGFYQVWMDAGLQFGRNVSARKYKTNIEDYPVSAESVLALQPVKYTLISSPEAGEQYGLIADDVARTLPEIVVFENDEPETIRYDLLAVALLDVVKEQQKRIDSLDTKHNLVLARLRTLEGTS